MSRSRIKIDDHSSTHTGLDRAIPEVVETMCAQAESLATPLRKTFRGHHLPSRDELARVIELLRSVIFPGYYGNRNVTESTLAYHLGSTLNQISLTLTDEIQRGLCFDCAVPEGDRIPTKCRQQAAEITETLIRRLPELRRLLALDAVAAFEGDPAATAPSEAIFCYPGLVAITSHRVAHELYKLGVPLIPRIISELAHSQTGVDIHPGARIGEDFFIDHGTGVVIGETSIIGDHVRIYQGVTLGAKSFPVDENGNPIKGIERHPIIEDDVTVYSGATILGRVTVGKGSIIGGNVWLTRSVPPNSRIAQARHQPEVFNNGSGI